MADQLGAGFPTARAEDQKAFLDQRPGGFVVGVSTSTDHTVCLLQSKLGFVPERECGGMSLSGLRTPEHLTQPKQIPWDGGVLA